MFIVLQSGAYFNIVVIKIFYIYALITFNAATIFRIGLAFAVNTDPSADGFTDAGIAMLNVFNFVAEEKGSLYSGLSFLTDVRLTRACYTNEFLKN